MQRAIPLVPLSHDHHHGLVVCRRIREGLKRNINPERIAAYVRDFWAKDLKRHFEEEELLFLPLLPESNELALRTKEEHRQLSKYIERMSENNSDSLNELLSDFATLLEKHIRFEERVLFPHIEQSVAAERLSKAAADLLPGQPPPAIWPDAFWK